jgi:hypothetical protein
MQTTVNTVMTRAGLEYYPRLGIYTVIDLYYNTVVIQTSSYTVAHYWRTRVNGCAHPWPYDVLAHDALVRARMAESI